MPSAPDHHPVASPKLPVEALGVIDNFSEDAGHLMGGQCLLQADHGLGHRYLGSSSASVSSRLCVLGKVSYSSRFSVFTSLQWNPHSQSQNL